MRQRLISIVFLILPAFLSAAPVWADAIVMTRAMTASTIVELFIEDDGIRLEMEIGVSDLGNDIWSVRRCAPPTRALCRRFTQNLGRMKGQLP